MKIYPVKYEIYDDDTEAAQLLGTIEAFDEESLSINIENKIIGAEEMKRLALALERAEKLLKDGIPDGPIYK